MSQELLEKRPLIILTGPTAVGKTDLSLKLAAQIGGEIISADSMQVYKYMDIGSAKIAPEEMQGIPHHLIDELEPWEEFNVVKFQEYARRCIGEIYQRGHIPVIAGGTGFYIQAVLYDIDFTEEDSDPEYREQLMEMAREKGSGALHQILEAEDEEAARQIHPNNWKRVIRALEYKKLTGEKISEHNARERERKSPYHYAYFVLTDERSRLYARIDRRVDQMVERGLVDEVKRLKEMGCLKTMVSMQGLGYKEILAYLEGACTLDEAVYQIKRDTRHFAKRQLTWFKRERDVTWMDRSVYNSDDEILEAMNAVMRERRICYCSVPDQ